MQTKILRMRFETPFDYPAALAALEKITEGFRELATVVRKKVRADRSASKRLEHRALVKGLKRAR
jgi:hypothetical protein